MANNVTSCEMELRRNYLMSGNYHEALESFKNHLEISQSKGDQKEMASAYLAMGKCYCNLMMYVECVMCYEKYLSIAVGFGLNERSEGLVCHVIGNNYLQLNYYDAAKEYLTRGLNIAKKIGDEKLECDCYNHLGKVYRRVDQIQESLKCFSCCLKAAQQIGYADRERDAYVQLGDVYNSLGKTHEDINSFESLLKFSQERRDKKCEANAYYNLAIVYVKIRRYYDKATVYCEKSAAVAKEAGDMQTEGMANFNLGVIYFRQRKFEEAMICFMKQLEIAKKTSDESREAKVYNELGNLSGHQGKYSDAIEYFERSLAIETRLDDSQAASLVQRNLSQMHRLVGKPKEAIACYQKSLNETKETLDLEAKKNIYLSLAQVYSELGHFRDAMECHLKFIILAVQMGDKRGEIHYYQELGKCFFKHGDLEEAIKTYKRALDLAFEGSDDHTIISSICEALAECYRDCGQDKRSIEFTEQGLKIAIKTGNKRDQVFCHSNLGFSYWFLTQNHSQMQESEQEQLMKQSEKHLKDSLRCCDQMFDELGEHQQYKISMMDTFVKTYKSLAFVLIKTKKIPEALEVSERGRARALGDVLVSKYGMKGQIFTSKSLENFQKKEDFPTMLFDNVCGVVCAFTNAGTVLFWVLSPKQNQITCIDQYIRRTYCVKDKIYTTIQYINNVVDSAYQSLKVRETINCEDRSLGIHKYSDEDDGEHLQTHSSKSALGINERLESTFFESGLLMSGSNHSRETGSASIQPEQRDECKEPLKELFKELMTPVQQYLTEDEIVIVPEGPLYLVPFAALQDPQTGRFLFETKRIRLAPSLTTLRLLKDCPSNYHSKTGALVIGNPRVGEVMFRGEIKTFDSLPAAEREAEVISALLGVEPLTGIHATKDAVKEKLRDGSAVIHIAAHGDNTNGQIALAPGISVKSKSIPDEENYILTMKEVQEIGVRAQLVVLSCCHSGRGEIRAEGVVGMSRAFLAAGARAVVASLWAIDDHATLEFMSSFYMYLKFGKSASLSLQKTMKELRESRRYRHPRFWAPFFLIGDDVTITKN